MYYLYKFLNEHNEIIYIGRTNDINRRIYKEHFTERTHLPVECYKELTSIEYAEVPYESQDVVFEVVLIQQFNPKYNTQFKDKGNIDLTIPNLEWKPLAIDDVYFQYLKNREDKTQSILDYIHYNLLYLDRDTEHTSCNVITTDLIEYDRICRIYTHCLMLIAGNIMDDTINMALKIIYANIHPNSQKIENQKYKKQRALIINLLTRPELITNRLISMAAMVEYNKLKTDFLNEDDFDRLAKALPSLEGIDFHDVKSPFKLKDLDQLLKDNVYDLILIDDIAAIDDLDTYSQDKMYNMLQQLKFLTKKYGTTILTLFHDVSKAEKRMDHRPMLSDLPYPSLRQYPDIINFIYTGEYYYPDCDKRNITEIIVAQNAFGPTGTIDVCRLPQYCMFANLAPRQIVPTKNIQD